MARDGPTRASSDPALGSMCWVARFDAQFDTSDGLADTVTFDLAELDFRVGNHERAAEMLQRAADLYRIAGVPMTEEHVLGNLAALKSYTGRYDEADALLRRALEPAGGRPGCALEDRRRHRRERAAAR